jgi:GTP pyrophosphokinase
MTSKQGKPSRDWLNPHLGYLKSSRAQAKVRSWFRQQDYEHNVSDGRALLDRELHRLSVTDINLEQLAKRFRYDKLDDFLSALGCGDISSAQIAGAVNEQVLPAVHEPPLPHLRRPTAAPPGGGDVQIMGVGDLMTHMARCCKPLPDDPIVGYVTRGRGVTIHRRDCPNLLRLQNQERERLLEVTWQHGANERYPVDIYVRAYDRQGLLRDITEILSNNHLNVTAVNTLTERKTQIADMTLSLEVNDVAQLSRALIKIEQLPNVVDVKRKLS